MSPKNGCFNKYLWQLKEFTVSFWGCVLFSSLSLVARNSQLHWGVMVRDTHQKTGEQMRNQGPVSLWIVLDSCSHKHHTAYTFKEGVMRLSPTHTLDFAPCVVRYVEIYEPRPRECRYISSPGSNYLSLDCRLAASPLRRNIQKPEGRTYWSCRQSLPILLWQSDHPSMPNVDQDRESRA